MSPYNVLSLPAAVNRCTFCDMTRTRRGNLESWIAAEPNPRGYYEAKVWMGTKGNGRPDRRHVQRKSLAAVRKEVRRLERLRDTGAAGRPGKAPTVEEMLTRHLTVVLPQKGRAPRTIADYWSKCRNSIFPMWGGQRIDRLTPEHIEDGLAAMLADGAAPATVRKVLAILSSAYELQAKRSAAYGMTGGTVLTNPCRFVDPPELGEASHKALTRRQARAVLAAARERGQFARWAVGLGLGLRQGEALGLRWQSADIDVPAGEPGEMRVWAQLQRLTWEHGCDDPHGCGARYHKTRPCPAKCSRHTRACPPPCPDDCADHARHCPRRKLPRGSIRLSGALVLREAVKEKKRKTVPIPAEVCEALREHRSAQFEQRMLAASEWTDHDLDLHPVERGARRSPPGLAGMGTHPRGRGHPARRGPRRPAHRRDDRHRRGDGHHGGAAAARPLQRQDDRGLRLVLAARRADRVAGGRPRPVRGGRVTEAPAKLLA